MGFSRKEYWSGLPFPSPGDLPDPRIEPRSPALQTNSLPTELWGWVTANKLLLITKHPSLWIIYLLLFFAKINKLKQIWVNLKIGAHTVRTTLTGEGLGQGELLLFFSHSVLSCSLQPHGLQHVRLPCPSLSPRVCSNSCPLSQWCHPTISSCRPLLLLPLIFPSIRIFSSESVLRFRWPKYWSFSFSISLSNEYSQLISFRIYRFDLLTVQGTLKSLLQHHSSKVPILRYSIQLSLWSNSHIHMQLLENPQV